MIRRLTFGFIVICSQISAQESFEMIFGTSNDDYLISTVLLDDSTSMLFLNSLYYNTSTFSILKISNDGEVRWRKKSEGDFDKVHHAIRTSDNCVVFIGSVGNYSQTIMAKVDISGTIKWCKHYAYGRTALPSKVIELANGNLVIIGSGQRKGSSPFDIYVIQTDSIGQQLWSYAYGGNGGDYGNSIIQCHNNTLLLAGYTYDFSGKGTKVYLVNIDLLGNIKWSKVLDHTGEIHWDIATDLVKDQLNNYYITGSSSYDISCIKLNPDFEVEWSKKFGDAGYDLGKSVVCLRDSTILIAGNLDSPLESDRFLSQSNNDVALINIDQFGDTIWSKTIGSYSDDFCNELKLISDSTILVSATSQSFSITGNYDAYAINTTISGKLCNLSAKKIFTDTLVFTMVDTSLMKPGLNMSDFSLILSEDSISYHNGCICFPPRAYHEYTGTDGSLQLHNLSSWASSWIWDMGDGFQTNEFSPYYFGNGLNICLKVQNECGQDEYCEVVYGGGSISKINKISLEAFPNPSSDFIQVEFDTKINDVNIYIYNISGQLVKSYKGFQNHKLILSSTDIGFGTFIIEIGKDEEILAIEKILFQ